MIRTVNVVKNWNEKHENGQEHVEWPPHSPNLNIIEHLRCFLERHVGNRYSPPSYLKELEQVLMKEWLKMPLDEVMKLYRIPYLDKLKMQRRLEEDQLHIK